MHTWKFQKGGSKMAAKNKGDQTKIENSLLEQLAMLGAMKEHYIDLIRDYMALWESKTALKEDIEQEGVSYKEYSSTGSLVKKNNPSVKDFVMVNKQMLSLLKELGISTANTGDGEGDEL
jgi:phage terminase small subunit